MLHIHVHAVCDKTFASLIFAVSGQSVKTVKIMHLENLALYGTSTQESSKSLGMRL